MLHLIGEEKRRRGQQLQEQGWWPLGERGGGSRGRWPKEARGHISAGGSSAAQRGGATSAALFSFSWDAAALALSQEGEMSRIEGKRRSGSDLFFFSSLLLTCFFFREGERNK